MPENLVAKPLQDIPIGGVGIWKMRKPFGDCLFEVLQRNDTHTVIRADNNITYTWENQMMVFEDVVV